MADMPAVRLEPCDARADLRPFDLVRPARCLPGRFLQLVDILFQMFVLLQLHAVSGSLVCIPGGKISFPHFYSLSVQYKHVVHAAVQKIPVVGDQDEALLAGKVIRDFISCGAIQMVRRLVDQEKRMLLPKKGGQQRFCLFAEA